MIMSKREEDRDMARLERAIQVYYRALLWVLEWCRYEREGKDTEKMPAFRVNGWDMKAIHVFLGRIVRRLADPDENAPWRSKAPFDYWQNAIARFTYKKSDGALEWGVLGDLVPAKARIIRVEFVKAPDLLPFGNIVDAIWHLGQELGVHAKDLFFKYDGVTIEDASTLIGLAMHATEPEELSRAITEWRLEMMGTLDWPETPSHLSRELVVA